MPFSQIHGHSSITSWREDDSTVPGTGIEALVTIDLAAKHETVYLAGGRLIGIDPDHRDTPTNPMARIRTHRHRHGPLSDVD